MAQMPNRRDQQRKKLFLIGIIVCAILAVIIGYTVAKNKSQNAGTTESEENGRQTSEVQTVKKESQETDSSPQRTIVYGGEKYVYNDHLSNYLVMGVDTNGSMQEKKEPGSAGQTDAIFLLIYDRAEESIAGLAIPRDTITQIELYSPDGETSGFSSDHLNLQYAFGDGKHKSCELTATAVSGILSGIPINGYAAINLDSIPELTEMLGGVEVTVPDNSLAEKDPAFKEGNKVILDASNTELFVRSRDITVRQSSVVRLNRQKVFLEAYGGKLAQEQNRDASTISTILETVRPQMITNMSNDLFADIATADRDGIKTIPGEAGHEGAYDVYRIDEAELYRMVLELFYEKEE